MNFHIRNIITGNGRSRPTRRITRRGGSRFFRIPMALTVFAAILVPDVVLATRYYMQDKSEDSEYFGWDCDSPDGNKCGELSGGSCSVLTQPNPLKTMDFGDGKWRMIYDEEGFLNAKSQYYVERILSDNNHANLLVIIGEDDTSDTVHDRIIWYPVAKCTLEILSEAEKEVLKNFDDAWIQVDVQKLIEEMNPFSADKGEPYAEKGEAYAEKGEALERLNTAQEAGNARAQLALYIDFYRVYLGILKIIIDVNPGSYDKLSQKYEYMVATYAEWATEAIELNNLCKEVLRNPQKSISHEYNVEQMRGMIILLNSWLKVFKKADSGFKVKLRRALIGSTVTKMYGTHLQWLHKFHINKDNIAVLESCCT